MARKKLMVPIDSSLIEYVYYDRSQKILHIQFTTGGYYVYYDVSSYRYYKLRNAESKGRYFRQFIRENYRYRRIKNDATES